MRDRPGIREESSSGSRFEQFDLAMKSNLPSALLPLALCLAAPAAGGWAPLAPSAPGAPDTSAAADLVAQLEESLDRGDLDRAIQAGEKAVEVDPRNSVAHDLLGRAYGLKAKESQLLEQVHLARRARAFFERAVDLDPANVSARADLATYDMRAPALLGGGREKARRQAEEVVRRDAARGHELLGDLAEREKNPAAAEAEYRRAVEASPPRRLRARRAFSAFLVRKGRFDRGAAALARDPRGRSEAGALRAGRCRPRFGRRPRTGRAGSGGQSGGVPGPTRPEPRRDTRASGPSGRPARPLRAGSRRARGGAPSRAAPDAVAPGSRASCPLRPDGGSPAETAESVLLR